MVTTNSGSARLTIACQWKSGSMNTGHASPKASAEVSSMPLNAAQAIPAISVQSMA